MSRHTQGVIDHLPEPDLPLRDRLLRLQNEVPRPVLQAWGAGLAVGDVADDSPAHPPIDWLGGTRGWRPYWSRVWGVRLLLHIGVDDVALPAVSAALADEAWRVREMALKVVAKHELDVTVQTVVELLDDPVARVREAAGRVLARRER